MRSALLEFAKCVSQIEECGLPILAVGAVHFADRRQRVCRRRHTTTTVCRRCARIAGQTQCTQEVVDRASETVRPTTKQMLVSAIERGKQANERQCVTCCCGTPRRR